MALQKVLPDPQRAGGATVMAYVVIDALSLDKAQCCARFVLDAYRSQADRQGGAQPFAQFPMELAHAGYEGCFGEQIDRAHPTNFYTLAYNHAKAQPFWSDAHDV